MNVQNTHSLYIVHSKRLIKPHSQKYGVYISDGSQGAFAPTEKQNKSVTKSEPVEVSFSGSFRSQEAKQNLETNLVTPGKGYEFAVKTPELDTLIQNAEAIFKPETKSQRRIDRKVSKFFIEVLEHFKNPNATTTEKVKAFVSNQENNELLQTAKTNMEIALEGIKADDSKDFRHSIINETVLDSNKDSKNENIAKLISKAREVVNSGASNAPNSKSNKKVVNFLNDVFDYAENPKKYTTSILKGNEKKDITILVEKDVADFANNKENLSLMNTIRESLQPQIDKKIASENYLNKLAEVRKNIFHDAVKIIQVEKNPGFFFKNKRLFKQLEKAADSQIVFSMLFALILTCFLRPASILALPGQKKNKDDKKYAAAHSIASGVVGYAISLVISSPIASALKKIAKHPTQYMDQEKVKYLGDIAKKNFRSTSAYNRAKKIINMGPEMVLGIPKAIVTIAIIPTILGYMKISKSKNNNPQQASAVDNKQPKPALASVKGGKQ